MPQAPSRLLPAATPRSLAYLGVAIVVVAAASVLGSTTTAPGLKGWYQALRKPWFNPPMWVFPVAWTTLFALMAFGFWRVLRRTEAVPERGRAIAAFFVQLACNVGWSFAFFGSRSVGAGLFVAGLLVLSVGGMFATFRKVDPLAGWLQFPYLAWVSFAFILNATIWVIN